MRQSTKLGFGGIAVALLFLSIGFTIGRASALDHNYGIINDGEEQQLVGKWQMSVKDDAEPWLVEFRADRTTIRYNTDGQPSNIANWGIVAGELSIQNAQDAGLRDGYMPPTIFLVTSFDDESVELASKDNETHWVLKKTL